MRSTFQVKTQQKVEIINITPQVQEANTLDKSSLSVKVLLLEAE